MTDAWTVDNDFITPTFKVKRNRIEEVYAPRLADWVARRKPVWVRRVSARPRQIRRMADPAVPDDPHRIADLAALQRKIKTKYIVNDKK